MENLNIYEVNNNHHETSDDYHIVSMKFVEIILLFF